MKTCDTCGNEIDDSAWKCPHCEAYQGAEPSRRTKSRQHVVTVNLKQGRPSVDEAMQTLDQKLATAHLQGVKFLRFIHGYGSSGMGGDIKAAVRRHLNSLRQKHKIQRVIRGENYTDLSHSDKVRLTAYPELKSHFKSDSHNPGVTIAEL